MQMYNVSTDETDLNYSQIKCRKRCYTKFTLNACGCKDFYFEENEFAGYPYCNLLQSTRCLKEAKRKSFIVKFVKRQVHIL